MPFLRKTVAPDQSAAYMGWVCDRSWHARLNLRRLSDRSAGWFAGGAGGGKTARTFGDPLGADTAGGNQFFHVRTAAFGAFRGRFGSGKDQVFKTMAAGFALVFVNGHRDLSVGCGEAGLSVQRQLLRFKSA
jgi:hypothetical protein